MVELVPQLGCGSLLRLHKLSDSQSSVMMVIEDAPVKVSAAFWTVDKTLS